MSEVVEEKIVEKEPLLSKKNKKLISDPLDDNNPITVQVLGICSALAVTSQLKPSLIMAICVVFVLAFSNLTISLIRKIMPGRIRMIVQLIVIAALVTIVDIFLKAFAFDVSKELSVFIGLIITNCIVMGRLEAFAMANDPWRSFLDGIGNGLGYGAILLIIAFFRELLGKGTLFAGTPLALNIIGAGNDYLINTETSFLFGWYVNNNLMVMPAAAMFIIAILIWIQRARFPKLVDVS